VLRGSAAIENILHLIANTIGSFDGHAFEQLMARIAVWVCRQKRFAAFVFMKKTVRIELGNDAYLQ